jgi:HlyD family secretion protein
MTSAPGARLLVCAALALLLSACSTDSDNRLQGWVEADLIFVSPDEQGRVETLQVREGDKVQTGSLLVTLDSDLQKADLGIAEANYRNASQAFERAQTLVKSGSGTQSAFDIAQAAYRETEARLNAAKTRLDRRTLWSPVTGVVQQVYYRPGETVPAGKPVVSILPPGNIKVRFYVPERFLARIGIGDIVKVNCDGCPPDITAPVTFISRSAEFTPPVIYSLEERSKLVYLVEARPEGTDMLRIGQPVDVTVAWREMQK